MVPSSRLSEQQLRDLAADSFDVLNWARRLGLKREQQVDELVRTFEVRLGYRQPVRAADVDSDGSFERAYAEVAGDPVERPC